MRILALLFEFPPINTAGVYRPLRFLNALAEQDNKVDIITIQIDDEYRQQQKKIDDGLLKFVHSEIKIHRLPIKNIGNKKCKFWSIYNNPIGDRMIQMIGENGLVEIENILLKTKPSLLFTSCPPFSSSIIFGKLALKYNLPFILDMRDAWGEWSMVPFPNYYYYFKRKMIERKVFESATVITTVTAELMEKFIKQHSCINRKKFKHIFNAPNYSISLEDSISLIPAKDLDVLHIGYTGAFYYTPKIPFVQKLYKPHRLLQYNVNDVDWKYRSPYFFFKILDKVFKLRPQLRSKVVFDYIGEAQPWFMKMIEEFNLQENVILHGYLSQKDVLNAESKFNLLLTTSEKSTVGNHYCLPSKIFTYLNSNKPILGVVTNGPQKELIKRINCGIILDPLEIEKSVESLIQILDNGLVLELNKKEFGRYEKDFTTQEFIQIASKVELKCKNNNS